MNQDLDLKLYIDLSKTLENYRKSMISTMTSKEYIKMYKTNKDLLERFAKRLGIKTILYILEKLKI